MRCVNCATVHVSAPSISAAASMTVTVSVAAADGLLSSIRAQSVDSIAPGEPSLRGLYGGVILQVQHAAREVHLDARRVVAAIELLDVQRCRRGRVLVTSKLYIRVQIEQRRAGRALT